MAHVGDTEDASSFVVIGGAEKDERHFARELDSKLKKLQRNHHHHHYHHQHHHDHRHRDDHHHIRDHRHDDDDDDDENRQPTRNRRTVERKPVFVTTVKTGIFLDPPPDLATLLGLDSGGGGGGGSSSDSTAAAAATSNRYYSYASKPRALYDKQHQRVSSKTRPDMCKQMGYTNIMHDKRVVRGSNFSKKPFRPKWNPYFGYAKQLSSESGKESSAAREAEARRRAMARKKAMDYQTRALRLHLGAPKLTRGRQNVDIQTDAHLEELYEYPSSQTFGAQTEFDQDLFSNPGTGTSVGTDASTQVDDRDLFDFDTEVTPVAENLIADVFRQAIREVLYEDELDAKARQQRALYLRHTIEEIEKQRLEHEEERLNKVISDHTQWFGEGKKKEKVRTSELTSGRVTDLLPEVLNELNQTGLTTDTNAAKTVQSPEFVSWLMEKLHTDQTKPVESDEILKSIIHDLIKNRLDTHNEVTDVQDIEKPEELFKEIESITLETEQSEADQPESDQKNEVNSR